MGPRCFHAIALTGATLILANCTNPMDKPLVVDGPRTPVFQQDEAECRGLVTEQVTVDADGRVIATTASNAAIAALAKANTEEIAAAAAIGMVVGAVASEQELRKQQRLALVLCMRGRGHNVLN